MAGQFERLCRRGTLYKVASIGCERQRSEIGLASHEADIVQVNQKI